eukprot:1161412-Pelagomonas_calceolata.AAC.4
MHRGEAREVTAKAERAGKCTTIERGGGGGAGACTSTERRQERQRRRGEAREVTAEAERAEGKLGRQVRQG